MDESERRETWGIRRDLNDLVRDENGRISGSKIGTYAGQYIAGHILLLHSHDVIKTWDSMAVLFLVLIAPEAYKRFLAMKWGGGSGTRTQHESTVVTKTLDTQKDST